MQSQPTDHARHAARWVTGVQASSSTGTSPLAFFDLIMDSAREATRSGEFQPLPRLENANRSAPSPDAHLDEEEDDETPRQSTAEDFQGRDLPLELPQPVPSQSAAAPSESGDHATEEAATAEISSEAIAQVVAAERADLATQRGDQAEAQRLSAEQRRAAQDATAETTQPIGEALAKPEDESVLDTAEQRTPDQTVEDPAATRLTAGESTEHDLNQRQSDSTGEPTSDTIQATVQATADERQAEQARRDGTIAGRRSATESQRGEDHRQQTELAAETTATQSEPAETRPTRRSSANLDRNSGNEKAETPNQQAAAEQATAKPPLTETPGSHQAESARGPVPVATGVETAKAVTGVEQGGTGEGSAGDGVSSLVQRGIQRGLIKSSSTPQPANPVDTRQQMRMVNRVARAVESTPPGQPVRIRLNPPELGALRIEIRIDKGMMTAKIEAETEVARQLLTENLPQLKERLAESNITVEKFEIELLGKETTGEGQSDSPATEDRQAQGEGGSRQRGNTRERSTGESAEGEGPPSRGPNLDRDSRNLNIVV